MKALVKSRAGEACGSKMFPSPNPVSTTSRFASCARGFAAPTCTFTIGMNGRGPQFMCRWSSAMNFAAKSSKSDRTWRIFIPAIWSAAKGTSSAGVAAIAWPGGAICARTRKASE